MNETQKINKPQKITREPLRAAEARLRFLHHVVESAPQVVAQLAALVPAYARWEKSIPKDKLARLVDARWDREFWSYPWGNERRAPLFLLVEEPHRLDPLLLAGNKESMREHPFWELLDAWLSRYAFVPPAPPEVKPVRQEADAAEPVEPVNEVVEDPNEVVEKVVHLVARLAWERATQPGWMRSFAVVQLRLWLHNRALPRTQFTLASAEPLVHQLVRVDPFAVEFDPQAGAGLEDLAARWDEFRERSAMLGRAYAGALARLEENHRRGEAFAAQSLEQLALWNCTGAGARDIARLSEDYAGEINRALASGVGRAGGNREVEAVLLRFKARMQEVAQYLGVGVKVRPPGRRPGQKSMPRRR